MANRALTDVTFHNGTTVGGDLNGLEWGVRTVAVTLALDISGTSLDAVLEFEGATNDEKNWYGVQALNKTTLDLSTSITITPGIYEIDLTGLKFFRVRISSITSGDVRVVGRVVD